MESNDSNPKHLNPHETPPQELKDVYKSWTGANSLTPERLQHEALDTESLKANAGTQMSPELSGLIFGDFLANNGFKAEVNEDFGSGRTSDIKTINGGSGTGVLQVASYGLVKIPGLKVFPFLLPPSVQQSLLSGLLHRELSNPENNTNLHLHYNISYPKPGSSFFSTNPSDLVHPPKDSNTHKPLTNQAILEKGLHWITLGGQYDWTAKQYPTSPPPPFPPAVGYLIHALFPGMSPQAAILNVYTPKDKLSLHRDVSETVDRGLVSISLGCSALFIIGLKDKMSGEIRHETILLRSGDVLYMSGESRFAWHGVPKIIPDTCPEYLKDWPGDGYPEYKSWMSKRRINLNVRQMY